MMQIGFPDIKYASTRRQARCETSLAETEQVVPWQTALALIKPTYPGAGIGTVLTCQVPDDSIAPTSYALFLAREALSGLLQSQEHA